MYIDKEQGQISSGENFTVTKRIWYIDPKL